jgi:hypothetical protein
VNGCSSSRYQAVGAFVAHHHLHSCPPCFVISLGGGAVYMSTPSSSSLAFLLPLRHHQAGVWCTCSLIVLYPPLALPSHQAGTQCVCSLITLYYHLIRPGRGVNVRSLSVMLSSHQAGTQCTCSLIIFSCYHLIRRGRSAYMRLSSCCVII